MGRIKWTAGARKWLRDIYEYIQIDNPEAALNTVRGIRKTAQMLEEFPESGRVLRHLPDGDLRLLLYSNYRIVYRIVGSHEIHILGVFHGALNIDNYLD